MFCVVQKINVPSFVIKRKMCLIYIIIDISEHPLQHVACLEFESYKFATHRIKVSGHPCHIIYANSWSAERTFSVSHS